MPVDAKPLFRPDALRPHLREYHWPDHLPLIREILTRWTGLVTGRSAEKLNEQEILANFLTDIFGTVLGYSRPVDNPDRYTFTRELQVFGKFADAALGVFRPTGQQYAVAIEGKGPLDPLDRPFAGRKKSAVDQGYGYAINLPCDWIIVTSMKQTRPAYPTSAKEKLPCLGRNLSFTRHDRWSTRAMPIASARIGLTAFAICRRWLVTPQEKWNTSGKP